jgi:hypothetical protein
MNYAAEIGAINHMNNEIGERISRVLLNCLRGLAPEQLDKLKDYYIKDGIRILEIHSDGFVQIWCEDACDEMALQIVDYSYSEQFQLLNFICNNILYR